MIYYPITSKCDSARPESSQLYSVLLSYGRCWFSCAQNNPEKDIDRKLQVDPNLFLIGGLENQIVGSVMGGYEGHRGWINYLAVSPSHQRKGYARRLMQEVEKLIKQKGCPKINLQVRDTNKAVLDFCTAIGCADDRVIGLGKRLEND